MLAPTNFLATNPDALERAIETDGQSLVDGLGNLVHDLERNEGELIVRLADETAFRVGENIATTPGEVVFRNRMFELIQYTPTTPEVHETPLLIFPPWINKFYILDLKAQNSLIKWIVDQGFTLFVVSWVNPDPSYNDTTLTDYVEEGFLTAVREVKAICGTPVVNAVGYCIAGTTLSLTLALMEKHGDRSVNSATFFTTLTDFSDQGEMAVFLDDDFVDGLERQAREKGILEAFYMSRTFSYLRSNDLIYGPAIRSYMMGQTPPAFDLLYWNGDSTNLPAAMAIEYLRGLCQSDRFATTGYPIAGETVHIADVKVPLCGIACETDHIAGWKSSYRGFQKMGSSDKTFILSESGHIAGIVNPPSKGKYGHWVNKELALSPEDWLQAAEKHKGSWWARWGEWLATRSGPMIPAREPGDAAHPPIAPAPGTYVTAVPAL
jgi:polyhydroxyalkanoate synthase